eukprot:gb/GECG01009082.1/.p1 GENE.gb/GECG01009082.1/~~gb/GECG01009082.1/.p1  ORF type:complete len:181 (+),score=14.78 gb/GECG01009082.1/:1-543(+)
MVHCKGLIKRKPRKSTEKIKLRSGGDLTVPRRLHSPRMMRGSPGMIAATQVRSAVHIRLFCFSSNQQLSLPDVPTEELPTTESLELTVKRFLPAWHNEIAPTIKSGKRVLVAAHGNSLRALVKYLDNISEEEIVGLNIPTGIPLVYELDKDLKPIKSYYLGDQEEIAKRTAAVASQASKK